MFATIQLPCNFFKELLCAMREYTKKIEEKNAHRKLFIKNSYVRLVVEAQNKRPNVKKIEERNQ